MCILLFDEVAPYIRTSLSHFVTFSDLTFFVGVRYFIRGVDDDGNVANYVETEQMMIYCDYRASFVQVIVAMFHGQLGSC